MTKEYEFHPLANVFPLIEGREFDDLVEDIEAHGLREPIVLLDGMILDGRNRYRACQKLGFEPFVTTVHMNQDEARAFVISLNAHRRHLGKDEKYALIATLLESFPNLSDRAIADKAKTNAMKVNRVRKQRGNASKTRVGRDGKVRQVRQPTPDTRKEIEDLVQRGFKPSDDALRAKEAAEAKAEAERSRETSAEDIKAAYAADESEHATEVAAAKARTKFEASYAVAMQAGLNSDPQDRPRQYGKEKFTADEASALISALEALQAVQAENERLQAENEHLRNTTHPQTVEQYLDALVDLLIDEPMRAVSDIFHGFQLQFNKAHKARRAQGVPCRPLTEMEQSCAEAETDIAKALGAIAPAKDKPKAVKALASALAKEKVNKGKAEAKSKVAKVVKGKAEQSAD